MGAGPTWVRVPLDAGQGLVCAQDRYRYQESGTAYDRQMSDDNRDDHHQAGKNGQDTIDSAGGLISEGPGPQFQVQVRIRCGQVLLQFLETPSIINRQRHRSILLPA